MLPIQKKLIKYNFSSGNDIRYIVIHDTANTAKGADAEAHYRYFNGGDRGASAHYFVDDHSILQLIEDTNAAWHVGDGKGKYGITNHNSIGIEICINADGDYDKAVANAIDLTKYLMQKYNIPLDRVVRHYDASRKLCPRSMSPNNWAKWNWFKQQLINKPVPSRSEPERRDDNVKIMVTYFGDADVFAAVIVAQKLHAPLMKQSDFEASGIKADKVIHIGGGAGDRFDTFKQAADLL